jgi:hypothetical protein
MKVIANSCLSPELKAAGSNPAGRTNKPSPTSYLRQHGTRYLCRASTAAKYRSRSEAHTERELKRTRRLIRLRTGRFSEAGGQTIVHPFHRHLGERIKGNQT